MRLDEGGLVLFEKQNSIFEVKVNVGEHDRILGIGAQSMSDSKQRMFILRDLTREHEAEAAKRAADRAAAASQTKTEMIHMLSHVSWHPNCLSTNDCVCADFTYACPSGISNSFARNNGRCFNYLERACSRGKRLSH